MATTTPSAGHILTSGAGHQYATIAAAAAAAQAGDTIDVQAGTYTNDFVTIRQSVTLQAVGGVVKMVATVAPPNGKAIIDEGGSGVSVTINGFDISGATVPDGNGAAVRYEGGLLTLNNDYFHNNQDGLLSNVDPAGTISINNSEFAYNGSGTGSTHNLYVSDIASLTITNSYFHDAVVGHEIKSRAESTTITNTRIFDNTSTASYSIDLPNGGNATIQNDVIQQGTNSQNPFIIAYGEEGSLHAGTQVTISGNTIVNDLSRSSVAAVWNATGTALTFSNNSVWGLTSAQLGRGPLTVSGTKYLASRPVLNTASTWMPASTPTPSPTATPFPTPSPTPTPSPVPAPIPAQTVVTIAPGDANPVVTASNVAIQATAGDHMLFIAGTHDTANLTGGTETVFAFQGQNSVTTGSGNDTIRFAGTGNVIDAGAGKNLLADSGSGNTLVMPRAGTGTDDVYGYVLPNDDKLDFRNALKATAWDGQQSNLSGFLHVSNTNGSAVIGVSATAGGSVITVATLYGSGDVSLPMLLQHAIV